VRPDLLRWACEAAGVTISRDLFKSDDPALLDRLAAEKLKAEAETIAADGNHYDRYVPPDSGQHNRMTDNPDHAD
jgi:hypothetical protein